MRLGFDAKRGTISIVNEKSCDGRWTSRGLGQGVDAWTQSDVGSDLTKSDRIQKERKM